MELEKLKEEADKLGYHLVKKAIRVHNCTCGTKPVLWGYLPGMPNSIYYECPNCDKKSEIRETGYEAKLEWNRMIEKEVC